MKTYTILVCCAALATAAGAGDAWNAVPADRIRLGGVLGWRVDLTTTNNFMQLDLEETFFKPFREKTAEGGFVGLGKLADAAVHLARYSGKADVVARKEAVIRAILETQSPDGYLGYLRPESRMKALWDLHDTGFLLQGLMSEYEEYGDKAALEAAKRGADYVLAHWKDMPANWEFDFITDREWTLGLGFGIARLYAATKDARYRDFLLNERSLKEWELPIVIGRGKMFYGQAYGYLGTALAQLEMHGLEPDPKLLGPTLRALDFMLHGDGTLVTGTGGIAECWANDQDGEGCVGETCFTVYELLVFDRLIRLGAADLALMGDLMERTIYNALFAAQSRDGRRLRYYTPLNGERTYFGRDDYCCPNNYRRGVARIPRNVFYVKRNAVYANLFTPCTAALDFGDVKVAVREETAYPSDGKILFTVEPERPAAFSFDVRVPRWCQAPVAKINGVRVTYPFAPGSVLKLPRVWQKGDTVALDFPMALRAVRGRGRQSGRFCMMRGPLVYALDTRSAARRPGMNGHDKGVFAGHPHDVQTVLTLDPRLMRFHPDGESSARPNGTMIEARFSTEDWSDGPSADGPTVLLSEYAGPDNTLTYFRTPDIEGCGCVDDELYSGDTKKQTQ
jgi:hypothetical protein